METFTKLFGSLLIFVYQYFDRIVINGYLSGMSRPEQAVHFVREVLGIPVVSKEILSQRTNDPNYRHRFSAILAHQTSRFIHYYFYIRDEVLGPILIRVASFFPFHATYWLNGH